MFVIAPNFGKFLEYCSFRKLNPEKIIFVPICQEGIKIIQGGVFGDDLVTYGNYMNKEVAILGEIIDLAIAKSMNHIDGNEQRESFLREGTE